MMRVRQFDCLAGIRSEEEDSTRDGLGWFPILICEFEGDMARPELEVDSTREGLGWLLIITCEFEGDMAGPVVTGLASGVLLELICRDLGLLWRVGLKDVPIDNKEMLADSLSWDRGSYWFEISNS